METLFSLGILSFAILIGIVFGYQAFWTIIFFGIIVQFWQKHQAKKKAMHEAMLAELKEIKYRSYKHKMD